LAEKKQNYLHGAAILTAGVVIMKILGAIYKIPLGNLLGTEAYGHFNAAYAIYMLMLTVSTAGLPVALSRMVSEANTLGRPVQARKTFKVAMVAFCILGVTLSLLMFAFPTELAAMMYTAECTQSIFVLAPAVLLVCITSAYRGYIQGCSNMIPTTISQVLEVLVKVVVGLILAWAFVRSGKSDPIQSAGAIFGVTVGSLAALIYMFIIYKKKYSEQEANANEETDSTSSIVKTLLKIGVPITLGASAMAIINIIDTALVKYLLPYSAGLSETVTKDFYGTYSLVLTLYNLPAAFITPLTISVVPAIAAAVADRRRKAASEIASSAIKISSIIAIPMGVGLAVLSEPIVRVVYPSIGNNVGAGILSLLGIASFLVCISLVSNAVLQAHGNERYQMISMIIGGLVKIGVNWVLVGNPEINIYGAPIGTICCYTVMCSLNWIFMRKFLEVKPRLRDTVLRPALSALVMGGGAWAVYGLLSKLLASGGELGRMTMLLAMMAAVATGVVLYLVMIIATRAITLEDMKLIPKGEKLAKLLKIK